MNWEDKRLTKFCVLQWVYTAAVKQHIKQTIWLYMHVNNKNRQCNQILSLIYIFVRLNFKIVIS